MDRSQPVALRPSEATKEQLANFKRMLLMGGEVAAAGLDEHIRRAEWLSFLFDDHGSLSGIGALKNPIEQYRANVFRKAGTPALAAKYPFELGWIYLVEAMRGRGYSKLLVKDLVARAGDASIYATTREENDPMIKALTGRGFDRVGHPFQSDLRPVSLILMVRPSA